MTQDRIVFIQRDPENFEPMRFKKGETPFEYLLRTKPEERAWEIINKIKIFSERHFPDYDEGCDVDVVLESLCVLDKPVKISDFYNWLTFVNEDKIAIVIGELLRKNLIRIGKTKSGENTIICPIDLDK
jgi:hypothetical protein